MTICADKWSVLRDLTLWMIQKERENEWIEHNGDMRCGKKYIIKPGRGQSVLVYLPVETGKNLNKR